MSDTPADPAPTPVPAPTAPAPPQVSPTARALATTIEAQLQQMLEQVRALTPDMREERMLAPGEEHPELFLLVAFGLDDGTRTMIGRCLHGTQRQMARGIRSLMARADLSAADLICGGPS